jgi:hypothetical protein
VHLGHRVAAGDAAAELALRLAQHRHHTFGIGRRGTLLRGSGDFTQTSTTWSDNGDALRECAVGGDPKLKRREARVCELCVKMGGDFNIRVVEISMLGIRVGLGVIKYTV